MSYLNMLMSCHLHEKEVSTLPGDLCTYIYWAQNMSRNTLPCLSEQLLHLTLIHWNESSGERKAGENELSSICDKPLIFYFCYSSVAVSFVLSDVIWNHKTINFRAMLIFFPSSSDVMCSMYPHLIDYVRCTTWKQCSISRRPSPSKINGLLLAPGCLIDTEWDWFCWIRDESLWVSPCRHELWNIIIYRGGRLTSLI